MSKRSTKSVLPLAYLAAAAVLAAIVLPSALRPPPDQANASSALSPDAPPEDDPETIIQSLQQAGSRTAGATGDATERNTTTTTIPFQEAPGRGQCYGDPPRAFDSVYAPPCQPAYTGDNGGSTSKGVTESDIRIGLSPDLSGVRDCGEIPETAEPGENDATRTYRVLRDFFNQNLELYGRRMRWFFSCAPDGTAGEDAERARGVRLAEEFGVFASIGEYSGFVADEATRRGVVHFANIVVVGDDFYAKRTPYLWGSRTNATKAVDFGSQYLCRRLNGHTPFPTGDRLIDYTKPRKFGILSLDSADTHAALVDMQTKLRERCGLEDVTVANYNIDQNAGSNNSQGIATAMARLKSAGVTTIVFMGEILTLPIHAQQADRNDYYPEWYLMGYGGFETAADLTRTVSPTQWQNAFGFSFEEIPVRPAETACFRAYKSMDPAETPNASICNVLFHSMTFLTGSIQEAGPDLNPESLSNALWRSFRRPAEPLWSMGGGFGPTDYTYGDFATELWWSPTIVHPDGRPGAYVYPNCGRRFSLDSVGDGNPDYMFQDLPTNTTYGLDTGPGCEVAVSRRRSGTGGGLLPLLYLAVAVALAAIVLPSALRPPPDQASSSAALSPDAPPDEDPETIIQSMQQAGSRTAGATGESVPPSSTTTVPVETAPTRGQCYGDPPRTGESLYAAPCTPAWQPPPEGNGGETHRNVFADEVRLGVSHTVGNGQEGLIPEEPEPDESSATRTLRVLQAYFNANYETYGRKIRIVQLPASSSDPVDSKAHAVMADEEYRIFGAYYLYSGFCTEMARRTLLTMCNPMPEEYHAQHSPYIWAWMMDYSKVDRMGAEYICKRLTGRNADFAGGAEQGRPRKFGLLYESSPARNAGRTHEYMERLLREQCGPDVPVAVTVDVIDAQSSSGRFAAAVARMRAAGVTTIVPQIEVGSAIEAMGAAEGSGYLPEWLLFFPYGLDINIIGNLLPAGQMAHAFGMSAWELPARNNQTDCFRAYKSIDPSGAPNDGTCFNFFGPLQQLANGIQQAGPGLTPETFRDGLYRQGHRFYPQPWAIGGGYGPGDHTYMDNMAEIWWSAEAAKPEDGTPGAYMWVDGGRRYREGEIPTTETQVFKNGTSVRTE